MKSDDILEVKIKKKEISFVVWLVPLLALVVGGWMIYKYYSKLGPRITITFKNSGGLEPKNSYIKFRDVKVGVVERVEILKRSDGVRVIARMNKDVEPFLNETTKFWIVRPEIGEGRIRGLDALVSGSYIQMYARLGKERRREFIGLDEPPLSLGEEPGRTIRLVSERSYDLSPGDPVYYRQMRVGKVEKVELAQDGKRVYIYVFVKDPYSRFINSTSRFWNIGSVSLVLGDQGIDVQMNSLTQILLGGIEFGTQDTEMEQNVTGDFYLYASKAEANRKRIGVGQEHYLDFLMRFHENVGYLSVGAPVKIDGFVVGKVKDIISSFDTERKKIDSYVIASIDISSFKRSLEDDGFANLKKLVGEGLKARLTESIPLLNALHVDLVFEGGGGTIKKVGDDLYTFPTTKALRSKLAATVEAILKKIEAMPIERTLDALSDLLEQTKEPLRSSLVELKRSLVHINQLLENNATTALPNELLRSLYELNRTLRSYEELARSYGEGSLFKDRIEALLTDIDKATKDAQKLLKKLDKKPNAIIFGD